jgi:hypothetical protein
MPRRRFSAAQAARVGSALGERFRRFTPADLARGMNVELEHGTRSPRTDVTHDDPVQTAKIALAHLRERPDYYTRLSKYVETNPSRPALDWPVACTKCKRTYTEAQWDKLPLLDVWRSEGWVTELRNCPCKGTMAVEWEEAKKNPRRNPAPTGLEETVETMVNSYDVTCTYVVWMRGGRRAWSLFFAPEKNGAKRGWFDFVWGDVDRQQFIAGTDETSWSGRLSGAPGLSDAVVRRMGLETRLLLDAMMERMAEIAGK